MKTLLSVMLGAALAAAVASPLAAQEVTVKSLTAQGFTVVSSFMTQIGPALLLQNGEKLYFCFVTETPDSPVIKTNYCKIVE